MTKKRKIGIAAFGLPVLLFLIIMAVMGQYPFGDDTLMILDMDAQYHAFFVHLRDILLGNASPWYSFSRALGGDMFSVAAYYLLSPFNLIFLFFNAQNIYVGIMLVMLLKIGTIGWSMNYYLCRKKAEYASLLFSTAYALSAYVIAYGSNIIWLDGIILLPIVALGIEKLVDEGKYLLYLLSIGVAVITSFYTGYMLCFFSVIYFICYFFFLSEREKKVKTILVYMGSSLLGGMLSGMVAIPTLYAMQDGKSKFNGALLYDWSKSVGYGRLAANSFVGMIKDGQLSSGAPLIYGGVFTVILMMLFFLQKEAHWKKKLAYFLLLAFLLFSLTHNNMSYIWQGFNVPQGAFYRYSFVYIFLILVVANEVCGQILKNEEIGTWNRNALLIIGLLLLAVLIYEKDTFVQYAHRGVWLVNIVLVLAYLLVLFLRWKKQMKTLLLLVLVGTELCVGAIDHFHYDPIYNENTKASEYASYVKKMNELTEEVRQDDELFRTVLTGEAYRSLNDSFVFNLYGLDSYTSMEQRAVQWTALQLGYYSNMVFGIHYKEGSTHAAETLLGVKYLISDQKPETGYYLKDTEDNLGLYENKAAIPFAMFADEALLGVTNEDYDVFRYQNEIFSCLGEKNMAPIFTRANLGIKATENCTGNQDGIFAVEDAEKEGYVEYQLEIDKEGSYYLQYITSTVSEVTVVINGETKRFDETEGIVKHLGYLTKDDDVQIRCYITGNTSQSIDRVYVYHEDETALEQYAKSINAKEITVTSETDHRVTVECRNRERGRKFVLFTIPWDAGWHVLVDGTEESAYQVLGNLMAVPIEAGMHTIELCYFPRGMKEGMKITGIAILLVTGSGVCSMFNKKRRAGNKKEETENDGI